MLHRTSYICEVFSLVQSVVENVCFCLEAVQNTCHIRCTHTVFLPSKSGECKINEIKLFPRKLATWARLDSLHVFAYVALIFPLIQFCFCTCNIPYADRCNEILDVSSMMMDEKMLWHRYGRDSDAALTAILLLWMNVRVYSPKSPCNSRWTYMSSHM